MPAVAVTQEAHERARTEAKAAGVGMGEWVSGRILSTPTLGIDWTGEKVPADLAQYVWDYCTLEGKDWEDGLRRLLMAGFDVKTSDDLPEPTLRDDLMAMAAERSETPAETLRLALEALAAPIPAVRPAAKETPLHADGQPYCSCDGEAEYGPHHREKCHRRTPA